MDGKFASDSVGVLNAAFGIFKYNICRKTSKRTFRTVTIKERHKRVVSQFNLRDFFYNDFYAILAVGNLKKKIPEMFLFE